MPRKEKDSKKGKEKVSKKGKEKMSWREKAASVIPGIGRRVEERGLNASARAKKNNNRSKSLRLEEPTDGRVWSTPNVDSESEDASDAEETREPTPMDLCDDVTDMHVEREEEEPSAGYTPSQQAALADIVVPETGEPIYDEGSHYMGQKVYELWKDPNHVPEKGTFRALRRGRLVKKLLKWYTEADEAEEWKRLVKGSNLVSMLEMPLEHVDNKLVADFVERWNPLFNTFNMPFGDMTIALHDVHILSGLPINGNQVVDYWSKEELESQMAEIFELTPFEINDAQD